MDIGGFFAAIGGGSAVTLAGRAIASFLKARADRQHARAVGAQAVDMHRDRLTFELLDAARAEVAAARAEGAELRSLQSRLRHFEEAIEHIVALLEASELGSGLDVAERHARVFLARIGWTKENRFD